MPIIVVEPRPTSTPPQPPDRSFPPSIGTFATRVYADIEPTTREDHKWYYDWMTFIGAVGEMFQELEDLSRDIFGPVGWSILVDIDRIPAIGLDYLAQFVGMQRIPGWSDQNYRVQIKATSHWYRGTTGAIIAATQQHLIPPQQVLLVERNGSPYRLSVVTYAGQTPNPTQTRKDILTQKPAGLILDYSVVVGQTYEDLFINHSDYDDVNADYDNYQEVLEGP